MTRYALNSAVLTAFGTCEYEPLNRTAAREWWEAGPVVATIGYEETCIAMERVLGIPRPRVNPMPFRQDCSASGPNLIFPRQSFPAPPGGSVVKGIGMFNATCRRPQATPWAFSKTL